MMKVAILNTDEDFVESLRNVLEEDGYEVATENISSLISGKIDAVNFLEEHAPDIIIYDIPPPYEEHWYYCRLIQKAFPDVYFVLTTTNKAAFERHVQNVSVIDILNKPFDIDAVLNALHRAEEVASACR